MAYSTKRGSFLVNRLEPMPSSRGSLGQSGQWTAAAWSSDVLNHRYESTSSTVQRGFSRLRRQKVGRPYTPLTVHAPTVKLKTPSAVINFSLHCQKNSTRSNARL